MIVASNLFEIMAVLSLLFLSNQKRMFQFDHGECIDG